MDRVEEERTCFTTILSSMQHAITCYCGGPGSDVQPLTIAEAREFIELAGQLLESESAAPRLEALLFGVAPSFVDVLLLIMTTNPHHVSVDSGDFMVLQAAAVANIGRLASLCAHDKGLSERLADAFRASRIIDVVSRYLGVPDDATQQTAMEALFFSCTKLRLGAEIAELKIFPWLWERVRAASPRSNGRSGSAIVAEYGASLLHHCCVAGNAWHELADADFFAVCIEEFEQVGFGSNLLAAQLARTLTALLHQLPTVFWQLMDARMHRRLGAATVALLLARETVVIGCRLVEATALAEAAAQPCDPQSVAPRLEDPRVAEQCFLNSFLAAGGAEMLIETDVPDHAASSLLRLRTLLILCECATRRQSIEQLTCHLLESHRPLSILLAAPMRLPPFHDDTAACARCASVIVGLLLAKNPAARVAVGNAIRAFPGWVAHLDTTIVAGIEEWFSDEAVELSIVDVRGALLNSVAHVDLHVPSAWYSLSGMRAVAASLLRGHGDSDDVDVAGEQEEEEEGMIDEGVESTVTGAMAPPFKRAALTIAVLVRAVTATFSRYAAAAAAVAVKLTGQADAGEGGNAMHTDDCESIEQWEQEEQALPHPHDAPWLFPRSTDESFAATSSNDFTASVGRRREGAAELDPQYHYHQQQQRHYDPAERRTAAAAAKSIPKDIVAAWREARPLSKGPARTRASAPFDLVVERPTIPFVRRTSGNVYRQADSPRAITGRQANAGAARTGNSAAAPKPWR